MQILEKLFGRKKVPQNIDVSQIREHFRIFLEILERNNDTLKLISELEEKSTGDYLFDMEFIKTNLNKLDRYVLEIIDLLNRMSKNRYQKLHTVYEQISADIRNTLPGGKKIIKDNIVIPFAQLDNRFSKQVGSKCSNLGELKNRIGLPVPDGFAISAFGYHVFMKHNQLPDEIQQ